MSVRIFAPAKINLTLKVGRPRVDGLHPLQSVVMFADVGDVVEAAPGERLSLTVTGEFAEGLSAVEDNLVIRAAHALAAAAGIEKPGASLSLEKNLPIASGIGGGSSDAAATLRALNALWELNLPIARLVEIARQLGSDVPVCVAAETAFMTGSGESSQSISALPFAAVLVNPLIPLPTANVYRQFDRMGLGAELSPGAPPHWSNPDAALREIAALGNDLEPAARALLPELDDIAALMRKDGRVRHAGLSGSGATMFALMQKAEHAEVLAEIWQRAHPDWWVADTILGAA
ncbi:MAG TPA: 4-(cytidine 5'-diphospho)-2-C-methyl-D-erythritol kinase [Candidatus Binatia bacterium]|nr:4-(cytidine 5'-diphospho)-2-C-methyl-D-erythritol kinase [Candidatus Binatia bacterium]